MSFDSFLRKIGDLQRRAADLEGTTPISFADLFPDEFMLRHTDFVSIETMIEASGFKVQTAEDFAAIPDDEWDRFVAARTRFESWKAMQTAAGEEWAARRLFGDT